MQNHTDDLDNQIHRLFLVHILVIMVYTVNSPFRLIISVLLLIYDLPSLPSLLAAFIYLYPSLSFLGNSVQISVHFSHSQETNSSWKEVNPNSTSAALTSFSSPTSIPCWPFLLAFLCYKLLALEMDLFHLFPQNR